MIVTLSSVAREIVPAGVETLAVFLVSALEATMGEKSEKATKPSIIIKVKRPKLPSVLQKLFIPSARFLCLLITPISFLFKNNSLILAVII